MLKTGESRQSDNTESNMEEKDTIKAFVSEREMEDGRESCLVRALEDANVLYSKKEVLQRIADLLNSSNEEDNCEVEKLLNQMQNIPFLSLVGYLILLDLIGEVFSTKSNIVKAIDSFGSEELKEHKWTVNALRNSLAHNYGLVNIPNNKAHDSNSLHKFTLIDGSNKEDKIFERERTPTRKSIWSDKSEDTSTKVYVPTLIKEIEKLYRTLKQEVENGNYKLCLSGGIEELKSRFTIIKVKES